MRSMTPPTTTDDRNRTISPLNAGRNVKVRTLAVVLSVGMALMLLGCDLLGDEQKPAESDGGASVESQAVALAPLSYDGPSSLEERILESAVIVRVRFDSATSTVESVTSHDGTTKYIALLEFSLSVLEYLKGATSTEPVGSDIVAVWQSRPVFDTRQEAEAALPAVAAARDTRWDEHEAIVFLQRSLSYLLSTHQSGRFYLSFQSPRSTRFPGDDRYSIASRYDRLWLPAEVPVGASSQLSGNEKRFLTDVPAATGMAATITLGEVKSRIAAVTARVSTGDGSEEFTECIYLTYRTERIDQHRMVTEGRTLQVTTPDHDLGSGLSATTTVYEDSEFGVLPDKRGKVWLDGGDSDLFGVEFGDLVPWDSTGDGVNDSVFYDRRVVTSRPLPAGTYRFHFNNVGAVFIPCDGYKIRYEWAVTAISPEGVLHELFFDPVTVGASVVADATNGVLKPASFTGATGSSATIGRISWESGVVKVEVTPDDALAGQVVDFIEIDGTVSLSLKVADATVDAANDTLSWSVSTQPWEPGDKLMARIRRMPPSCSGGVAVPNPSNAPDLVRDCERLLRVKDTLAGTGTLNWGVDRAISSWDGVTTGGTPKRVTGLNVSSRGLSGIIPPALGELDRLSVLDLSSNLLTGEIPSELGRLSKLVRLRLSGNRFAGCIPAALLDVNDHDLDTLGLEYCTPLAPAPQGLSVSLSKGEFAIGWDMVNWVDRYRVQYRAGGSGGDWASIGATPGASMTFSPVGGLVCETTYEFRVQARGDGTTWAAEWGEPSDAVSLATGTCNPPPAPGGVEVVANSDGTFGVTWTAVTGADMYRVRYRVSGDGWSDVGTTTDASVTVSPSETSQCGSVYELGVRARGDGVTYIPAWGAESVATSTRGGPCNSAPVFGESGYSFSIAGNAPSEVRVGTVSATDPDGDTVSYSISAGDTGGKFAVATSTGRITVARTLDLESVSSYSLTVDASDGNGGTATTTVAVSVATSSACYGGTVVPNVGSSPVLARDCEILLSVRDTLTGTSTLNWSASTTVSTWDGVSLHRDVDGVHMLYLTGQDLNGTIPPGLGEIENLHRLDLDENRLTGPIPPELAGLSRLNYLFLFDNMLTGGIPPQLGTLSRLRDLDVSDNPLSGEIPPELGSLSSLERLALETNRLTGEIPPELGNLSALTELWLRYNRLSGEIPSELQGLSNLNDLFVSSNSFTGCIPIGLREVNEHDLDKLGLSYCAPPSAPTNLTASTTHDRVTLSWDAPAGSFVTGYQVLRRRPDHGETDLLVHVADTGSTDTTYTDTDVGAGTRYVYRIKAINSAGIGPYSRPVTATTARAP